jgi:RNase P subunit RPR2
MKKIFCNFCQNELTYNKYEIVENQTTKVKIIHCEMCGEKKIVIQQNQTKTIRR